MSSFKKKRNGNSRGFSLMEVIIAVGIVSFAFVGIMSIFAANVRMEILNRDRITAAYLAQEGVEIVRHKRDTNWFTGGASNWDTGLVQVHQVPSMVNPYDFTQGWNIVQAGSLSEDKYKQKIFLVNNNYIQVTDSIYNDASRPASWKNTKFRRLIDVEKITDDQMKVTVTVYYGDDSTYIRVISYLYNNWYTN